MTGTSTLTDTLVKLARARDTLARTLNNPTRLASAEQLNRSADAMIDGGIVVAGYDTVRGPNLLRSAGDLKSVAGEAIHLRGSLQSGHRTRLRGHLSQTMIGLESVAMSARRVSQMSDDALARMYKRHEQIRARV